MVALYSMGVYDVFMAADDMAPDPSSDSASQSNQTGEWKSYNHRPPLLVNKIARDTKPTWNYEHCSSHAISPASSLKVDISALFNTLRPRQDGCHFPEDIFKCIFLNENVLISIKFSLNIVPDGPINNIPALVQQMAWRRLGDIPLSEPIMVLLLTHICVTQPQWVKTWETRLKLWT